MAKRSFVSRTLDFLSENIYFSWFWQLISRLIGLSRTFSKKLPAWLGLFGPFKTLFEGITDGYATYKAAKETVQHRMEHIIAGSTNAVGAIFNVTVGILLLVGVINALTLANPFTFIMPGVAGFLALVNLWKDIRIYRYTQRELALTRLLPENTPTERDEKQKKIQELEKKLTNQKITFIFHVINWIILGLGIVGLFFPPVMILTACLAATSAIAEMVTKTEWFQKKLHRTPTLPQVNISQEQLTPTLTHREKLENRSSNDKYYTQDKNKKQNKTMEDKIQKKRSNSVRFFPKKNPTTTTEKTKNPTTEHLPQTSLRPSLTNKLRDNEKDPKD